jgi:hypothetical protein
MFCGTSNKKVLLGTYLFYFLNEMFVANELTQRTQKYVKPFNFQVDRDVLEIYFLLFVWFGSSKSSRY